jgi:hypothetical protein
MIIQQGFVELCYQKLTAGKIYAGLLMLENYRAKKSGTEVCHNATLTFNNQL